MSDPLVKLQHELHAAQRALSEAQERCVLLDVEHKAATLDIEDNRRALLFMLEDIERTEDKVEQTHRKWMATLDVVEDPIFIHDNLFRILRCNKAYQRHAGMPFKQIIGQPYYEVFPKTGEPLASCLRVMKEPEGATAEEEMVVGEVIYRLRAYTVHNEHGLYLQCAHILEDITERRRAEQEHKGLSDRLLHILASTPAIHYTCRVDGENYVPTYASPNIIDCFGYDYADCLGNPEWWRSNIHPEERSGISGTIRAAMMDDECNHLAYEYRFRRKDGTYCWVHDELQLTRDKASKPLEMLGAWLDISKRKLMEEVLKDSEEQYRTMIENSNDMIWTLSADGKFTFFNQKAANVTGRNTEEWLGESFAPLLVDEDLPRVIEIHGRIMHGEKVHYEARGKKADGGILIMSVNASPLVRNGMVYGSISFARDITASKQAEISLRHANRALATLSAVNRSLVHAKDEGNLLNSICQSITQQRGYRLAWVGYVQDDEVNPIKIMAHSDQQTGSTYMQSMWIEKEISMKSAVCAISSGSTQICQDIINNPHCSSCCAEALKYGYAASITLPLMNEENIAFGILIVKSNEANTFSSDEVDLLEEMADDLAFGVCALHVRQERDLVLMENKQQLTRLQDSLESTVRALSSIVEMRDPYTAGHQARVADLAVAIAKKMGLSDDQVHSIHLAGAVHDLGKIRIPAEILSKPGRITDIEYSLIKMHAQAGYDILKDIKFPWPLAQIVLQHHERLDGSGYPQGLKGEAILLEARIISVSDVVEAIFSHRPYRPGLGVEAALGVITRFRGIHFDAQVVDACVALINERKYVFAN